MSYVRKETLAEGVDLYLGDMLEVLPTLGVFDACVTDPPYGIGAGREKPHNGWRDYGIGDWDLTRPPREVFDLVRAKSGVQIIWGGNYFTDFLPPSMQWLVWDKAQRDFSLADVELAWSSQDRAARAFTYSRALALQDGKEHPTQKPVELMKWCLGLLPKGFHSVVDPFLGSGTTGVAAVQRGFSFAGIEREPSYFDIACRRISKALAAPDMFTPAPAAPVQEAMF